MPKHGGRFSVKELQGQFRVELLPQIFHQICHIKGTPEIDLFASRLSHQLPKYFAWRSDSYSQGTGVIQHPWRSKYLYVLQSKTGQGRQNASCGTHLAISNLVSNSVKYVNRETNAFTTVPVSTHESTKTVAPTSDKQNLKIGGVDRLREKLFT